MISRLPNCAIVGSLGCINALTNPLKVTPAGGAAPGLLLAALSDACLRLAHSMSSWAFSILGAACSSCDGARKTGCSELAVNHLNASINCANLSTYPQWHSVSQSIVQSIRQTCSAPVSQWISQSCSGLKGIQLTACHCNQRACYLLLQCEGLRRSRPPRRRLLSLVWLLQQLLLLL